MANQPAVTILYPAAPTGSDAKPFDFDYYINKHMTKLQAQWPKFGLLNWQVIKLNESSGWTAMCLTYWKDTEGFMKAAAQSEEIMADGPNYSSAKPVVLVGSVIATSPK